MGLGTELAKLLKDAEVGTPVKANVVCVHSSSQAIELLTDISVATYGEWIEGEGADICLLRDVDTKKVVGVRLPTKFRGVLVDTV